MFGQSPNNTFNVYIIVFKLLRDNVMRYFIETSSGNISVKLTEDNKLVENSKLLVGHVLKQYYKCDKKEPISLKENNNGLFIIVNLEDNSYGSPEYKIREREENNESYWDYCIIN
jgi:hypothetical protein